MADYLNRVILKGRLGKDPEIRYLPSGDAVANFNIATKKGTHVEWHRIVAYKKLADRAKAEFAQGDLIYFEGEIVTREMISAADQAKQLKPRKITELIADDLRLVEKKRVTPGDADDIIPKQDNDAGSHSENNPADSAGAVPRYI